MNSFFAKLAEQMKLQMSQYRRTFEVSGPWQLGTRESMLMVEMHGVVLRSKSRGSWSE